MRTRIHVTTMFIIVIALFGCGIFCTYKGIRMRYNYNNAIALEDLRETDIEEGVYVKGYIDSYVAKDISSGSDHNMVGCSQTYIIFVNEYEIYTIGMKDNGYIQVMTGVQETKDKLARLYKGNGESIYFEGKIVESPVDIEYDWYDGVDESVYPNIDNIVSEFIIEEINAENIERMLYTGITLIVLSVMIYVYSGGIKSGIGKECVEEGNERTSYKYSQNYNIENELHNEEMNLKYLQNRQMQLNRQKTSRICMLAIGLILFIAFQYLKLIAIVLIIFAIKGLWECFINSGNELAIRLAKTYKKSSNSLEIAQCRRKIAELKETRRE